MSVDKGLQDALDRIKTALDARKAGSSGLKSRMVKVSAEDVREVWYQLTLVLERASREELKEVVVQALPPMFKAPQASVSQ